MSLNDSITSLSNATVVVTRTAEGTYVDGIYIKGATTTFPLDVVLQPAFNLNRVVGGANLDAKVDNQKVTDVRVFYTTTELKVRTPDNDPDLVAYKNAMWTVARVEDWELNDEIHYRVIITRSTGGAS